MEQVRRNAVLRSFIRFALTATAIGLLEKRSRQRGTPRRLQDRATPRRPQDNAERPGVETDQHGDASGQGRIIRPTGDDRHGRAARAPSQISVRGWKDILWRIYQKLGNDRVLLVAAGVTFYVLLAIFPAIAAVVAIYGLFADPATISAHLDSASGLLPAGALDIIREQMARIASGASSTLGLAFIGGLLVSLWSANAGIKSLFDALNIVYGEEEQRGFFRLNLISFTFTVLAIVFMLMAIAVIVALPIALDFIGLGNATEIILRVGRWPVLLAGVVFALAVLYRYGPSRSVAQWRWLTWGSGFAALGWIIVSILFSWYAANYGSYNKTYGSLGAVIGFMIWLWLSIIVVLLGAELNAEMEHRTAKDTTTGQPRPMGLRGARMADTLGAAESR